MKIQSWLAVPIVAITLLNACTQNPHVTQATSSPRTKPNYEHLRQSDRAQVSKFSSPHLDYLKNHDLRKKVWGNAPLPGAERSLGERRLLAGTADLVRSARLPEIVIPSTPVLYDDFGSILHYADAFHTVPWNPTSESPNVVLPVSTVTNRSLYGPTMSASNNCVLEIATTYQRDKKTGTQDPVQRSFIGVWDHTQEPDQVNGNWVATIDLDEDVYEYIYQVGYSGPWGYGARIAYYSDGYWRASIYNWVTNQYELLAERNGNRYAPQANGWSAYEAYYAGDCIDTPELGATYIDVGSSRITNADSSVDNCETTHPFVISWYDSFITGWTVP